MLSPSKYIFLLSNGWTSPGLQQTTTCFLAYATILKFSYTGSALLSEYQLLIRRSKRAMSTNTSSWAIWIDLENLSSDTLAITFDKLQILQKLKSLGIDEFNHLIIILTLSLTCGPRLSLNKWSPTCGIFNFLNGR